MWFDKHDFLHLIAVFGGLLALRYVMLRMYGDHFTTYIVAAVVWIFVVRKFGTDKYRDKD